MPMPQPLRRQSDLVLSHMGFYVKNLEAMGQFYKDVLGFIETDRGDLGVVQLIFLSRDPNEHHQLVLASGRPGVWAVHMPTVCAMLHGARSCRTGPCCHRHIFVDCQLATCPQDCKRR